IRLTGKQRIARSLLVPLERRALVQPATKKVIAVSQLVRQNLAHYYGRSDGVNVIHHGTDVVRFHPENRSRFRSAVRSSLGVAENAFVALYVGDLKKGATAAIRAVAKTAGVTLLVVSPSPPEPYRQVAEAEAVADRVIFHPHSKEVERFFAAADAFVFPTVYDPFGLVITEAMASGLPVVTSRAAGAAELIAHGVEGFLTERAWDVDAIARHLAELRDDPAVRERMSSGARARVEPLTWDRTAAATLAVYRDIVPSRGNGRSSRDSSCQRTAWV
ncbi:MAG TPA: glycosyltransferase family 4 protein, partial [Gemmata sp.]|nr:glycosyltransferase family 4 protein [Gemmata sp.]